MVLHDIICLKHVYGIANSVDPDQIAPLVSALFVQTCLSTYLIFMVQN